MSLLSSAQMLTCDMNKSQQNYMMSRTVAEQEIMNLRKELSDANAKLKNAANARTKRFLMSPGSTRKGILNSR